MFFDASMDLLATLSLTATASALIKIIREARPTFCVIDALYNNQLIAAYTKSKAYPQDIIDPNTFLAEAPLQLFEGYGAKLPNQLE
jgi:hypothetical protein